MSNKNEEDKSEAGKVFPLDLASKLTTTKPADVPKSPLIVASQPLRSMRLLAQPSVVGSSSTATSVSGTTIISANIVPQAVLKQVSGENVQRAQVAGIINSQPQSATSITVARPAQITFATSMIPQSSASYHVPRGPAVVANLTAPRSTVAPSIRAPIVASSPIVQQAATANFVTSVRPSTPSRTPSPAGTATLPSATAWLSNAGIQVQTQGVKGVISSTIQRIPASTVPTRTQVVARAQPVNPSVRPAVIHSAITIAQSVTQMHTFKPGSTGIQTLGNTVTLAQVLPARTQTLVYSTGNTSFVAGPRLTVTGSIASQKQIPAQVRPGQVTGTRLTVPISISQGTTRLTVATGQANALTTGTRITSATTPSQSSVIGSNTRIGVANSQPGRLSVSSAATLLATTTTRAANTGQHVLSTPAGRVVSLQPVVMTNTTQARTIHTHTSAKMVGQAVQSAAVQLSQLGQIPTVGKTPPQQQATVVPVTVTVAPTPTTRTINVTSGTIVSQRPVNVTGSQAIPIAKVFPQGTRPGMESGDCLSQPTNVFIHTGSLPRHTSPGPAGVSQAAVATTSVTSYSLSSGTTYYYETSGGYGSNNLVARPYTPSTASFASLSQAQPSQIRSAALAAPVHSLAVTAGQPVRFNPIMVVEQGNISSFIENSSGQSEQPNPLPSIGKLTSSPRPSILRKRDNEGSPLKAAKNLTPVLASLSAPVSPPSRPDSRGNGQSSGGSTTISATSSPGLGEHGEDSLPLPSVPVVVKQEPEEDRPSQEMSPRKKPRKQQLSGNDLHSTKFNIEDIQFISDSKIKREESEDTNSHSHEINLEHRREVVRKPAPQLLNSYKQSWKSTHNHYLRYTDVKPKDERRPTIIDLANQSHVLQKVNGWKIHHLSTQMEDLSDLESQVYDTLTSMLKVMEATEMSGYEREINRISELIKGNMQRSKIINDGILESKTQVMKVFDHKGPVSDIISRCASKRNFKKRDKF